jgi:ADP-ribose pyrophosphatase YjhB (NUDIX family)
MDSLTYAVAAVVTDPNGRVLLCRQTQGHRLWGLPNGRIEHCEHPAHAAVRDIRAQTGLEVAVDELIGLYRLTGPAGAAEPLPDLLVHAFRAHAVGGEPCVNAPAMICRVGWYDPDDVPSPHTATVTAVLADLAAGRRGVVTDVHRSVPATDTAVPLPA